MYTHGILWILMRWYNNYISEFRQDKKGFLKVLIKADTKKVEPAYHFESSKWAPEKEGCETWSSKREKYKLHVPFVLCDWLNSLSNLDQWDILYLGTDWYIIKAGYSADNFLCLHNLY